MPGPVSDSFDPEFGTGHNCHLIREALQEVYRDVSAILGNRPPMNILDLVESDLPVVTAARLSEKQWRLIRFALERAEESI